MKTNSKVIFSTVFKGYIFLFVLVIMNLTIGCQNKAAVNNGVKEEYRDPLKWPFATTSIWNMPIGDSADYVHAQLQPTKGLTIDEDIIVLKPNAPLMPIYQNFARWHRDKDRCIKEGDLIYEVPFPTDFVYNRNNWDGATPNAGLAVLMADGRTIKQNQPFARCESGGYGTSEYLFEDVDIYGDGTYGAHGGSGLSAIGGALRYWELRPGSEIRHALKINLYCMESVSPEFGGYRWPAKKADSGFDDLSSGNGYNGKVKEVRMGCLLAIHPADFDSIFAALKTEPAKIFLKAFTNYGAYLVDNTAWDVWALVTSFEPDGRFTDEFKKNWGFDFVPHEESDWKNDMELIYSNLHVVDNNGPKSIGGGGVPRCELAPELTEPEIKK